MAHTPGPWRVHTESSGIFIAVGDEYNYYVAEVFCGDHDYGANSRLIAAAPELLEWLQAIVDQGDAQRKAGDRVCTIGTAMLDEIRAAIAKATGA